MLLESVRCRRRGHGFSWHAAVRRLLVVLRLKRNTQSTLRRDTSPADCPISGATILQLYYWHRLAPWASKVHMTGRTQPALIKTSGRRQHKDHTRINIKLFVLSSFRRSMETSVSCVDYIRNYLKSFSVVLPRQLGAIGINSSGFVCSDGMVFVAVNTLIVYTPCK